VPGCARRRSPLLGETLKQTPTSNVVPDRCLIPRDHWVFQLGLFHLKRSDESDQIIDVLLACRVATWIECLETGSPSMALS
jgi:hypothetical protein